MGIFYVSCEIENAKSSAMVRVTKLLVDTGSEYTWIPEQALRRAGIAVRKRDVPFVMANGQTVTRDVGYAILRSNGFETVDEVVFGKAGDLKLLGSRTLEGFAATVDSQKKKLVTSGPLPAA